MTCSLPVAGIAWFRTHEFRDWRHDMH